MLSGLVYYHVDVFTDQPLTGNGLTVFFNNGAFTTDFMQDLTREMRQFESVFLTKTPDPDRYLASIFTMEEELGFAGHPLLGAACTLHYCNPQIGDSHHWKLRLRERDVEITTRRYPDWFEATMNQGRPLFELPLSKTDSLKFLAALNLDETHLTDYPLQVVSTGLPYLIVPLTTGLERARIVQRDFEALLATIGAKFVYVFDIRTSEGRTWSNDGLSEDAATGSAAGPMGAYLVQHGLTPNQITIQQGSFIKRPSQIKVSVETTGTDIETVYVSGAVRILAHGQFV